MLIFVPQRTLLEHLVHSLRTYEFFVGRAQAVPSKLLRSTTLSYDADAATIIYHLSATKSFAYGPYPSRNSAITAFFYFVIISSKLDTGTNEVRPVLISLSTRCVFIEERKGDFDVRVPSCQNREGPWNERQLGLMTE